MGDWGSFIFQNFYFFKILKSGFGLVLGGHNQPFLKIIFYLYNFGSYKKRVKNWYP